MNQGLEKHLGYLLRQVSNSVSMEFARKLADFDITVAEWVILHEMHLHKQDISPSEIALLTGLSRGAISKLIERLVKKEYCLRSESRTDRRFQKISITKKAIKLVPRLIKIADNNDKFFFSYLSDAEHEDLRKILTKLILTHKLKIVPIE